MWDCMTLPNITHLRGARRHRRYGRADGLRWFRGGRGYTFPGPLFTPCCLKWSLRTTHVDVAFASITAARYCCCKWRHPIIDFSFLLLKVWWWMMSLSHLAPLPFKPWIDRRAPKQEGSRHWRCWLLQPSINHVAVPLGLSRPSTANRPIKTV